jgi:hypothetical protein
MPYFAVPDDGPAAGCREAEAASAFQGRVSNR